MVKTEPPPQEIAARPTVIRVRVQHHDGRVTSDLAWQDVDDPQIVNVNSLINGAYPGKPDLEMWAGTVTFGRSRPRGRYRLVIEEYEYVSSDYTIVDGDRNVQAGRLIYVETIELDEVLLPAP